MNLHWAWITQWFNNELRLIYENHRLLNLLNIKQSVVALNFFLLNNDDALPFSKAKCIKVCPSTCRKTLLDLLSLNEKIFSCCCWLNLGRWEWTFLLKKIFLIQWWFLDFGQSNFTVISLKLNDSIRAYAMIDCFQFCFK